MRAVLSDDRATLVHGDCLEVLRRLRPSSVDAVVTDPPAGIGFMGKGWDSDKGGRDEWVAWLRGVMAECLRVLKPGGHALVWALPRTSHWTATAIEDAGFEIRDVVMHLFGSGFPKSLDVSKAIDARLGAEREIIGRHQIPGNQMQEMSAGGSPGNAWTGIKLGDPVTAAAAAWDGWGTALKPAAEHWILARKPLDGTVADNVLAHGTGALNVNGCRIGTEDTRAPTGRRPDSTGWGTKAGAVAGSANGRWPAHVVLDEGAAAVLDEQADVKGGASRFFYCAKPAKSETEAGLDHLPVKTGGEATDREDGSDGLNSPRAGAGRGGGRRNHHPTKKPVALMRWLVRLVTPPGGVVLDPFAGSGTTGIAALAEGCRFVGVELTEEYLPILEGRIRHALREYAAGGGAYLVP